MLIKTKAIVISSIRYQDKSLIVKCLTKDEGVKSYFVNNAFTGKNNKFKIAFFQPLTILEVEANHKNKGTLERFKEIKVVYPFQTISFSVEKTTILLFLSEILHTVIKEEADLKDLFLFLETALQWFDTNCQVSNFHLIILLQLTKYLGFYPQKENTEGMYFEMEEGIFKNYPTNTTLSDEKSMLFFRLLNLKISDDQLCFSVKERRMILDLLMQFYSINIETFRRPKSLEVLREVFE